MKNNNFKNLLCFLKNLHHIIIHNITLWVFNVYLFNKVFKFYTLEYIYCPSFFNFWSYSNPEYLVEFLILFKKLTTHFPPYLSHVEVQNLSTSETSVCLCRLRVTSLSKGACLPVFPSEKGWKQSIVSDREKEKEKGTDAIGWSL